MAYSDYGAFVYCNGERRTDKEDAPLFAVDEEAFGANIDNISSGSRIWMNLLRMRNEEKGKDSIQYRLATHIAHGIMGDGNIRVRCYKQGLPGIYEVDENGEIQGVKYLPYTEEGEDVDYFNYRPIKFDYKGYHFEFYSNKPYEAVMITPEGDQWTCEYDYSYGSGFEN